MNDIFHVDILVDSLIPIFLLGRLPDKTDQLIACVERIIGEFIETFVGDYMGCYE